MKALISGYYGFDNAGDELILDSIITELRARDKSARITVLSESPEKTAEAHGVHAISRWNPFLLLRAMRECDRLIMGGGGLFQDMTGNLSLYYYLAVIMLARLMRKKVFIYAAGVNNLKSVNRALAAKVLGTAAIITLREPYSLELLKRWGCRAPVMEVTADPVLGMDAHHNIMRSSEPRIGLILRPPLKGSAPVDAFAALADSLHQRISAQIIFIPFHIPLDLPFTLRVMNSMRVTARLVRWTSTQELFNVFAGLDMVVSQRLHGLILASLHGIPLVGISQDDKIERFLREMGQKNIDWFSDATIQSLLAVIVDMWEWREEARRNSRLLLPALRQRARRTIGMFFQDFERTADRQEHRRAANS